MSLMLELAERGMLPDPLIRLGIRVPHGSPPTRQSN